MRLSLLTGQNQRAMRKVSCNKKRTNKKFQLTKSTSFEKLNAKLEEKLISASPFKLQGVHHTSLFDYKFAF